MEFQWEYEKRISELEAERENNYGMAYGRGYNAGCNDSKAMLEKALAERDQLAASLKRIEDADQRLAAEYEGSLEAARKALENIRNYIRSNSGADWDNVRAFCKEALAQLSNPTAAQKWSDMDHSEFYSLGERLAAEINQGVENLDKVARNAIFSEAGNAALKERGRAVRTDHEYDQNPTYSGPGCAVCGLPRESHAEGAKKLEERDRAADAGYVDVEITVKYRRRVYHTVAEDMKHLTPRELAQQDLDDVIAASVREFGLEE